jgi:predicted RNA binding protein YcfA (HicA-like mRNA interferase family)
LHPVVGEGEEGQTIEEQAMKVRDLIRRIENDGWEFKRQRGSHRIYRHPHKPGTVTVAGARGKDIPYGTLENILWQAGLKGQKR